MKMRIFVLSMLVLVGLVMTAPPAIAGAKNITPFDSVIYDNGGPFGFDGVLIDTANATSDTVHCATHTCTPTDLEFWTVNPVGQSIGKSVTWSFTSGEFMGVGYNSGSSLIPTSLPCIDQGSLQVCDVNITLAGTLAQPQNSWLNLTGLNSGVEWAFSADGHSQASTCELNPDGSCGATLFNIPGEAFNVTGTPAVPEPSSIMLFGSGILGLVTVLRRRWLDR